MRATFRFSTVASWRATAKSSGLDLVRATARMAVSASSKAEQANKCIMLKIVPKIPVASSSGSLWVNATVSSFGLAWVSAVARVSSLQSRISRLE